MALQEFVDISSGPLRGLVVLDFGQAAVGPIAPTQSAPPGGGGGGGGAAGGGATGGSQ